MCVSGCDQELVTLEPTEMVYSIFGYLDPASDTQWIRVAPLRGSILSTPEPVDAQVRIEEVGTGRLIELTPTLFTQIAANFGDTLFAYNFRTTEQIQYSESYRLVATRSDGSSASSLVRTPPDVSHLPVYVTVNRNPLNTAVPIRFPVAEGDHVAMVLTYHYPPDSVWVTVNGVSTLLPDCAGPPMQLYSSPLRFTAGEPGYRRGNIIREATMDRPFPCGGFYEKWDFRVVRSPEPWPFSGSGDYRHVHAVNNIENGAGFLGGLATRRIPIERCILQGVTTGVSLPTSCEFVYGPATATLRVVLTRSWIPEPDELAFAASVSLLPEGGNIRREAAPEQSWDVVPPVTYWMSGFLAGRYTLRVGAPNGRVYCDERVLDLVPGEQTIELELDKVFDFPDEPLNANGCREGP
jgi:hypothetical protein